MRTVPCETCTLSCCLPTQNHNYHSTHVSYTIKQDLSSYGLIYFVVTVCVGIYFCVTLVEQSLHVCRWSSLHNEFSSATLMWEYFALVIFFFTYFRLFKLHCSLLFAVQEVVNTHYNTNPFKCKFWVFNFCHFFQLRSINNLKIFQNYSYILTRGNSNDKP